MKNFLFAAVAIVALIVITGMSNMNTDNDQAEVGADNSTQGKASHKKTVKPHANIDINHVMPYPIHLNEVVNLQVRVINGLAAEDVKVHFTFDEGLSSADDITKFSFGPHSAGASNNFEINFFVEQEGRAFINLFASMMIDGQYQTRSFAIAVVVGDIEKNKSLSSEKDELQETPEGERVISMPAKESGR